jgi:hypothetical protein
MPEAAPEYLTPNQARPLFPGRPSISAMWRWATRGCHHGGQVIRLPYTRCGRRIFLTREGIQQFLDALRTADEAAAQAEPAQTPKIPIERPLSRREKDIAAARQRLEMAGI